MHIVFVLGSYFPMPSPTSIVAQNIIDVLKKKADIEVICYDNRKTDDTSYLNGVKVHYLKNWFFSIQNNLRNKNKPSSIFHGLYSLIYLATKPLQFARSILLFPNGDRWFIRKTYKTLTKIQGSCKIDYVVSVCAPFSAHIAAMKFKNANTGIKWYAYTPDVFSEGIKANRSSLYRRIQLQRAIIAEWKVYSSTDMIIHMDRVYIEHEKAKNNPKSSMVLHTVIDFSSDKECRCNNDTINCVYAGSFLPGMREPFYAIESFKCIIRRMPNLVLNLYGDIRYDDYFSKLVLDYPDNIIVHGKVKQSELKTIISHCDFLIDIGNKSSGFIPSKIYEYVSTGLPIISFCHSGKHDETLNRYPYSLQVDANMIRPERAAEVIASFIHDYNKKRLSSENLKSIYYLNSREYFNQAINNIFQ